MSDMHIKVTTETLLSISADVSRKIEKVQTAFDELEGIIKSSASYWEGKGQRAFENAYEIRKENYQGILTSFHEHIVNLQEIAGVYEQTEQAAEDLAMDLAGDVII